MVRFVIFKDEHGAKIAVNPELVASVDESGTLERERNASQTIVTERFVSTPGQFDLRLSGVKETLCLVTVKFDGTLAQLVKVLEDNTPRDYGRSCPAGVVGAPGEPVRECVLYQGHHGNCVPRTGP